MQKTLLDEDFEEMDKNTLSGLRRTKDRVKHILERYPASKGDDRILIYYYYRVFEPNKIRISFPEFKKLMEATSTETIRRCRQLLNHEGLYLPTDKTVLKRRHREIVIHDIMRGHGV